MKKLNNAIQESYCSFEVSKLLKEKGFNAKCNIWQHISHSHFKSTELMYLQISPIYADWNTRTERANKMDCQTSMSVPTHALAIEWIRVNFGIWICIEASKYLKFNYRIFKKQVTKLLTMPEIFEVINAGYDFQTPQEAESAALLYVLQNLIIEKL